jgi:hypothetical protein
LLDFKNQQKISRLKFYILKNKIFGDDHFRFIDVEQLVITAILDLSKLNGILGWVFKFIGSQPLNANELKVFES